MDLLIAILISMGVNVNTHGITNKDARSANMSEISQTQTTQANARFIKLPTNPEIRVTTPKYGGVLHRK